MLSRGGGGLINTIEPTFFWSKPPFKILDIGSGDHFEDTVCLLVALDSRPQLLITLVSFQNSMCQMMYQRLQGRIRLQHRYLHAFNSAKNKVHI